MAYLYRHYDKEGKLLYIGKSLNPFARTQGHKRGSKWFPEVVRVDLEKFATKEELAIAEKNAIINEKPEFNIHFLRKKKKQSPSEKRKKMYFDGDKHIGIVEYLKRADMRKERILNLIRMGKDNSLIARAIGISSERVRQIRLEVNGTGSKGNGTKSSASP